MVNTSMSLLKAWIVILPSLALINAHTLIALVPDVKQFHMLMRMDDFVLCS